MMSVAWQYRDNISSPISSSSPVPRTKEIILEEEELELQHGNNKSDVQREASTVILHSGSKTIKSKKKVKKTGHVSFENEVPQAIDNKEFIDSLIREYFSRSNLLEAKEQFEIERPRSANSISLSSVLVSELNLETQHKRTKKTANKSYPPVLQTFVEAWDASRHNVIFKDTQSRQEEITQDLAAMSISTNSTSSKNSSLITDSSAKKKKPNLSVVLPSYDVEESVDDDNDADGQINALDNPGNTPKHGSKARLILGRPGSTPRAKTEDLVCFGIDDIHDPIIPANNIKDLAVTVSVDVNENAVQDGNGTKKVKLGEPGHTPRKEYVFFKTTPPNFITETLEEAIQISEKLANDPAYIAAKEEQERYVELESSDVGKYTIGQTVAGLGENGALSGTIYKKFGSRQCGSAGPGTIVIDTFIGDKLCGIGSPTSSKKT